MSRTDLNEFHIRRKSICWYCGVNQVSDWKWKRLVSNSDYFSRDMIVPSGFTRVNLTQHQGHAVFVYQLKTESIFIITVYLSYFRDTCVGIVFVDGITDRSNAVVKPNISCNPWEIILRMFGNITGIGFRIVIFAEKDIMSVSEPFVWKERTYCGLKSFFAQRSLKYFCIDCFLFWQHDFLRGGFLPSIAFQIFWICF